MWVMTNTINPQINPFINSANNSSFDCSKTSKKKDLNENYSHKNTPIHFGFNFYFDNMKSSPFTPINSNIAQQNIKNNNINQKVPILFLFRSSLEKSGYKLSSDQIVNTNEIMKEHNNIHSYCQDNNYCNIPLNSNYSINNNSIINNIYPTFNKVTNVKILSDTNKKNSPDSNKKIVHNLNNLENRKDKLNHNILKVNIIENENQRDNNDNNSINKEKKIILNKLDSKDSKSTKDDLNEKKIKVLFECSETKIGDSTSRKNFLKKKRLRKNNEQIVILSKFYMEHKKWSKKEIKEMSENIGLKETKIYKWLWDQKNKEYRSTKFVVNKNNS